MKFVTRKRREISHESSTGKLLTVTEWSNQCGFDIGIDNNPVVSMAWDDFDCIRLMIDLLTDHVQIINED